MSKPTITVQEIFDKVATHLMKQGKKSTSGITACLYHAPDGCKCAVGCLIPDEAYNQSLEGKGVNSSSVQNALPFEIDEQRLFILNELQFVHDYTPVDEWHQRLQLMTDDHGLTMPEVQYD